MPIKRMVWLAASAVLLCAALVSIRGISYIPTDQPPNNDPTWSLDPSQDPGRVKEVELRVDVSMSEDAFSHLEALNETFMKLNPDVTVVLNNLAGQSEYEYYMEAFRLGEVSDIMLMDNEMVMQFAVMARLVPADDYYTSDAETVMMPALVNQLKWNGYIWGIPFQVNPYILAYHRDQWAALTGDAEPANIEHLISVYQRGMLHVADPLSYAAFATALNPQWQEEQEAVDEQSEQDADGEQSFEDTSSDTPISTEEAANGEEHSVQAHELETVVEETPIPSAAGDVALIDREDPVITTAELAWEKLQNGEIAAMITALHDYDRHHSESIAARIVPTADGSPHVLLSGQSFVLSANTPYQEAAFRWIRSISENYHQSNNSGWNEGYPARMDAYEKLTVTGYAVYPILLDSIQNGAALLPDPRIRDKLDIVAGELSNWQAEEPYTLVLERIAQQLAGLLH